jgi:hypothetical protein
MMQPPDTVPLTSDQRAVLHLLLDGDTTGLDNLPLLSLEALAGALRQAHGAVVAAHDKRRERIGQQGKETRHG